MTETNETPDTTAVEFIPAASGRKVHPTIHYTSLPFRVRFCLDMAAHRHGVRWVDILRQTNYPKYVAARHEAMLLVSEIEEQGLPVYGPKRIGEFFLRHHSTVIYGVRRAKERREAKRAD